jgi:cell division inhibitor SepF
MAGAMRKAMVYLGLVEDEDHYDYDEYDDAAGERDGREDRRGGEHRAGSGPRSLAPLREDSRGSVATMTERRPQVAVHGSSRAFDRITTIHPRTYNEAKQIGESFRESTPVIMNLSDMDDSDAKRLVDFAAGLVFGLRGTIERVTNKVFLLSPANVTVTAEDKARMAESGFFNQS